MRRRQRLALLPEDSALCRGCALLNAAASPDCGAPCPDRSMGWPDCWTVGSLAFFLFLACFCFSGCG